MRLFKRILLFIIAAIVLYGVYYAWRALPILTGYGAKNLCSCVMLAGRAPDDVIQQELSNGPVRYGSFAVDYADSSATGSLLGLAKRKAIYRKGLGCTLISELDEAEIRDQNIIRAQRPLNTTEDPWPVGDVVDSTRPALDYPRLEKAVEDAFSEPGPNKTRRTRALLIVYDGKIVAERYAKGFTKDSKLIAWSMTKSFTNALVGILVKEGKLKLDEPAPVDAWKQDERKNITLHHLMQASSGLAWEENYSGPSNATNMLFRKKDAGLYAANVPLVHEPGKVFYYSSGTTNIISRIIRNTLGDEDYYRFPYERLFYKIGMFNTVLEPDAGGTFVGSSFSYGTARDFARFGLLYLNDGLWNGERILPEGWVRYTTTPAPGAAQGQYGAQFWLNAGAPENPANRPMPDVPTDLFSADGFEGQNIFIIPSKKLVVVKLSLSQRGEYLDDNIFLKEVVASIPDDVLAEK